MSLDWFAGAVGCNGYPQESLRKRLATAITSASRIEVEAMAPSRDIGYAASDRSTDVDTFNLTKNDRCRRTRSLATSPLTGLTVRSRCALFDGQERVYAAQFPVECTQVEDKTFILASGIAVLAVIETNVRPAIYLQLLPDLQE